MTRASPADRSETDEREDRDTYWITDPAQLKVNLSPRRHEIVDHLAASGPMSIKELARQIGAQPSALYHHIDLLRKVGLVLISGHRVVNRKRETLYATPAPRMRMLRALGDPKNREIFKGIAAALTRQMSRDFDRGLDSAGRQIFGDGRNLGFFRLVGSPDQATLAKINRHLGEIAELLWNSGRGEGDPLAFSWTMAPLGDREAGSD